MVKTLSKYELLRLLVNFTSITNKQLSELYQISPYKLKPYLQTVKSDKITLKSAISILKDDELLDTICSSLNLTKSQVINILSPKKKLYLFFIKDTKTNKFLTYDNLYSGFSDNTCKFISKSEALNRLVTTDNENNKIVKFEMREV